MADPVNHATVKHHRRHDLDALRAFAMLLGIALHAALSFTLLPWIVQDTRRSDWFGLMYSAIHGFRMPMFFLVSGYFTALLWQRRGAVALLQQRAVRILVPLLVGMVTIIPLMDWVAGWAMRTAVPPSSVDDGSFVSAIRRGDFAAAVQRVEGADVDQRDAEFNVTPLSWATMRDDLPAVRLLIDRGADVNGSNGDGSTPLHGAAFLGREAIARLLIDSGADVKAKNLGGELPYGSSLAPWEAIEFVTGLLRVPIGSRDVIEEGRAAVQRLILAKDASAGPSATTRPDQDASGGMVARYQQWMSSPSFNVDLGGQQPVHLFLTPVFQHLWFLWFLIWLLPCFLFGAWLAQQMGWIVPKAMVLSPIRFLWLIPLTLIPQQAMGMFGPVFGPDTSVGLLPQPHVLLYYAIFFGYGALVFAAGDDHGQLGRYWWALLPGSLLLLLPLGLAALFTGASAPAGLLQVAYAWAMSFGMLGLFRRFLPRESYAIRYMSDASYWLYLTHLPAVVAAQAIVREWPMSPAIKFVLICSVVTGLLLIVYQLCVRYTWIGTILNGPRHRPTLADRLPAETTPAT